MEFPICKEGNFVYIKSIKRYGYTKKLNPDLTILVNVGEGFFYSTEIPDLEVLMWNPKNFKKNIKGRITNYKNVKGVSYNEKTNIKN